MNLCVVPRKLVGTFGSKKDNTKGEFLQDGHVIKGKPKILCICHIFTQDLPSKSLVSCVCVPVHITVYLHVCVFLCTFCEWMNNLFNCALLTVLCNQVLYANMDYSLGYMTV